MFSMLSANDDLPSPIRFLQLPVIQATEFAQDQALNNQLARSCIWEYIMRVTATLVLFLLNLALIAQHSVNGNLVPNPGFEEYDHIPEDWFYTGSDFSRAMRYWESPTGTSPDIYGPRIYVPNHWRDKGFGQAKAFRGQSMVGLTIYGCHGGKPHCREYIQTQLFEALVPGQRYEIIYWVHHLPNSLQINNLGIGFSPIRISTQTDEMLNVDFNLMNNEILSCAPGQWIQCKHEFHAQSNAGYLIIGNFRTDTETRVRAQCEDDCLPFAYYYIDEVMLRKLPPILPVTLPPDDLSFAELQDGDTVRLNYIFFDSGKADFLPRSFRELNLLLDILQRHPEMHIEIHGHTDHLGTTEYNQELSLKRAENVVNFLISHGIRSDRLSCRGFGAGMPLDDNDTEAGRTRNRRVEFHILKM